MNMTNFYYNPDLDSIKNQLNTKHQPYFLHFVSKLCDLYVSNKYTTKDLELKYATNYYKCYPRITIGSGRVRLYTHIINLLLNNKIIKQKIVKIDFADNSTPYSQDTKDNCLQTSTTFFDLNPKFFVKNNIITKDSFVQITDSNLIKSLKNIDEKISKYKQKFTNEKINIKKMEEIDEIFEEIENMQFNQAIVNQELKNMSGINFNSNFYIKQLENEKLMHLDTRYAISFFNKNKKELYNKLDTQYHNRTIDADDFKKYINFGENSSRERTILEAYNNVTIKTITASGRLYHKTSIFPKKYKKYLSLNHSKSLFEIDIPTSQPRMVLFVKEYQNYIDDNYKNIIENGDIYSFFAEKTGKSREFIKKELFKLVFFAKHEYKQNIIVNVFKENFPKLYSRICEIRNMDLIHPILKNSKKRICLNSFYLQNAEAIKMQNCINSVLEKNPEFKFVCIHDSVLLSNIRDTNKLLKKMNKEFNCKCNLNKIK